jgi:hypothetical protein
MVDSAKLSFDDAELVHLRCVIRLTVEFRHYLEHGSVEFVRALQQGPLAHLFEDLQGAAADPFNKYDLEYTCDSIRSGVESFCDLNQTYRIMSGATGSRVQFSMMSSMETFKKQFISMFGQFIEETNFENKCRLLLDLFKLQMAFAAITYE